MVDKQDMKERAREVADRIMGEVVDVDAGSSSFLYAQIQKALIQFARETREATIRQCADIANNYVKEAYTADTGTECENLRNNILALLNEPSGTGTWTMNFLSVDYEPKKPEDKKPQMMCQTHKSPLMMDGGCPYCQAGFK